MLMCSNPKDSREYNVWRWTKCTVNNRLEEDRTLIEKGNEVEFGIHNGNILRQPYSKVSH